MLPIGWTLKRRLTSHPFDCGFPRTAFPTQGDFDPWDANCGNGEWQGNPIAGASSYSTSIPITTTFVISWIRHLTLTYGAAVQGGVQFYNLDNEPMLWNSTHRDVHPTPTGDDELRDRT